MRNIKIRIAQQDESMNKKMKRVLNSILSLMLAVCVVMVIKSIKEDATSQNDYNEANMLAGIQDAETTEIPVPTGYEALSQETEPEATHTQESIPIPDDPVIHELLGTDLEALRQENEDVVGWITMPGTIINYPLMQWTDNQFYLQHTWKQTPNINGSIFIECQNKRDFTDFNTIIYGHNMSNGAMFGTLRQFRRQTYWEEHPTFYIACDQGVLRYDIFAVHKPGIDTIIYGLDLDTDEKKTRFIRFATDYSSYDTEIMPTIEDRIVTLSTCSGQGYTTRWVVQGVLNEAASYIIPE